MIGKRIKEFRESNRISQRKLAEDSDLSVSYIQQLEYGKKMNPSIDKLKKISNALGVELWQLTSDDTADEAYEKAISFLNDYDPTPYLPSKFDSQYVLNQGFKNNNLEKIAKELDIPLEELENAINLNDKLSLDAFQKICFYFDLEPEEESFWYANYIYTTTNENFKVITFYNYLVDVHLTYCNIDATLGSYIDACISLCNKFKYNFILNTSILNNDIIIQILNNIQYYKEVIINMYKGNLHHHNFDIKNLTDEEYYNLYNELIETLDIQLYKLERIKESK